MNKDPSSPSGLSKPLKPTKVHHVVLLLAAATSMVLYLHRYTWLVIRPELAKEYGYTNTELEQIFAFFQVSYTLGQIPAGIICDFFGARVFLSAIVFSWSISLVIFAVAGTYFTFCASRLIFGAAQAGAYPSLSNVSRNWFPSRSRTTMQGFVASFAGRAGAAVAPIIMATILMGYFGLGWRTAIIIMAVIGLILAVAFYLYYRNDPSSDGRVDDAEKALLLEDKDPSKSTTRKVMSFKQAMKNRGLVTMVIAQVSNAGADIVYTTVLGSFFLSKQITIEEMGIYASFPLFGGAIGGFVGGYLNDFAIRITGSRKWGRRIMGSTGKVVAAGCVFIAIAQTSVFALAVGLFVVKFFSDWSQPTVWGTCTDIGGPYSATVFSIVNTAGNFGAFLVPPFLVGPLLDRYTSIQVVDGVSQTITDYNPMFVVVAGLYVFTALLWLTIDCTKRIEPEREP